MPHRLRWRRKQPITVLELRCRRLAAPLQLHNYPELWGCFSWVSLPAGEGTSFETLWADGVVALTDGDFARQQAACRRALAELEGVTQLEL